MGLEFEVRYGDGLITISFSTEVSTEKLLAEFVASGKYSYTQPKWLNGTYHLFRKGQEARGVILAVVSYKDPVCKSISFVQNGKNTALAKRLERMKEASEAVKLLVADLSELAAPSDASRIMQPPKTPSPKTQTMPDAQDGMLDLGKQKRWWGLTTIPFRKRVFVKDLQAAAGKLGYKIILERTGIYCVYIDGNTRVICKIKTKQEICVETSLKEENNLPQVYEFNAKLSPHINPKEEAKTQEKPPELKKIFDKETLERLHKLGNLERCGSMLVVQTNKVKSIHVLQKAALLPDCRWKAGNGTTQLFKKGLDEPVATLKREKERVYHLFMNGSDKQALTLTFLDKNRQILRFLNISENADFITNLVRQLSR